MRFEEKAVDMGLTDNQDGSYSYQDVHGAVCYKRLSTPHENIPYVALFAGHDLENLNFTRTILSELYEFEGNESLNNNIRNNIQSSNANIFRELTVISKDYCTMYNQIIIDNSIEFEVGTIYPSFVILNSYNGTRRKEISFGITIEEQNRSFRNLINTGFRDKLGTISQIHSERHSTILSTVVGDYVEVVSANIQDVINMNLNNELEVSAVLSTLEYIEHLAGKKRRAGVSSFLEELTSDENDVTSWDLFLSILRYSQNETNLNVKIAFENLAEKILELPQQMIEATRRINN